MKRVILVASAVAAVTTPAFAATPVYNSAPAVGFHYGAGNDYSPANAAVLRTGSDLLPEQELSLRFHQTGEKAPASDANGVYSFALGTQPISFDWGLTSYTGNIVPDFALITVTNVGTGQTVSYNPFFPGNDNFKIGQQTAQNSARLNFGFLLGSGFTPNVDSTYRVNLAYAQDSISIDAVIGAGAGTAVPEPATWAMMIGGFGLLGAAARRRVRTSVTYA